jgi:molybdopterin synthase catalytic subunit
MIEIRVQQEPFELSAEQESLCRGHPRVGALVSFVGLMRDLNEGKRVSRMTLEHYPGMTEKALTAIAEEAAVRWELVGIRIIHRVGPLEPQDPIVLVAVTSAHRGEAFRACEFLIDYLKTKAPFWKKEVTEDGGHWVDARATDDQAAARWGDSLNGASASISPASHDSAGSVPERPGKRVEKQENRGRAPGSAAE